MTGAPTITRRTLLAGSLAAAALPAAARAADGAAPVADPFSPATVRDIARDLAARAYEPVPPVPPAWTELTYDQYRGIRFDQRQSPLNGTDAPIRLDLFPPGLYFPRPVGVALVEDGAARTIDYRPDMFARADIVPPLPDVPGFSGLRVRAENARRGGHTIYDEFAVFQGASYFRMIPWGAIYGLSARGIALGTGKPGEEFPDFTRFWVERPAPGARETVLHALLDGPTLTGAYRFALTPGDAEAICDVEATLYARRETREAGWAPLTSMFLFDGTNRARFEDWRPAVHDSDGLAIHNGQGERIWRPLANPRTLQISAFLDESPRGFGLSQRSRRLSDFQDLEALYHRRPSLWVEPRGDWGRGHVHLVEIPADREIYDNTVAYWLPDAPLVPGAPQRLAYRMRWRHDDPDAGVAQVVETRIGRGFDGRLTAAIDWGAHALLEAPLEDGVTHHVAVSKGEMSDGVLQRNPETGGARLTFAFEPGEARTVEMRAQLRRAGTLISEVWLYRWTA